MTQAERDYVMRNAPPLTMPEMRNSWYNWKREKQKQGEDISFMDKYKDMGVEALARAYNTLVQQAREMGLDSVRQVARFKDVAEGQTFIGDLESRIRARQSSEKAVKAEARQPGPVAKEVAPTSPPKAGKVPASKQKEDETMAKKAKAAKKTAKKAKKAGSAAKAPAKRSGERPNSKAGEFAGKINTLPGSHTDKLTLLLFANLGKQVPAEKAAKEVYGNSSADSVKKVKGRVGVVRDLIAKAKVSYHVTMEDGNIGLFTGSGK
jgi:hypothetical protein